MNLIYKQGKLCVITEMPLHIYSDAPKAEDSKMYQQALLSAPSIEVENEDDVHFYICKSDDHFDGLLKEGQVYSLPDDKFKYEVKSILQSRYGTEWYDLPGQTEGRDPEGIYRTISVAIISEVTPKEENQNELWNEVFNLVDESRSLYVKQHFHLTRK